MYEKILDGSIKKARSLRRQQTDAEKILWRRLRNRRCCRLKFRRQAPIGKFVVDFLCTEKRLVVEVDGSGHFHKVYSDRMRGAYLASRGLRVLRFTNSQVIESLDYVVEEIARATNSSLSFTSLVMLGLPQM